jgi:glycosyltransferase involved in cell wall biosynthesis
MNLFAASLERIAGRWTDYLIVLNREDFQAALRLRLVPGERLHHMPGIGIDTTAYSRDAVPASAVAALRGDLGLAEDQPLFAMIAAFDRGKRHADALRAFAELSRSAPSAHLAFAGRGRRRLACEQLAARLGVADRVHFLGYRNDIPVLTRASVATLLPSEREGLPRSVMESLSLETPVIGSDARGISDLLADGSGLTCPVGDAAGLARHMEWILNHPHEAELMGRRGRDRLIAAGSDQASILSLHEELYSMALDGRREC